MRSLSIILASTLASIAYGIALDNVTARMCVEYFTIGHAPISHTESPTLLALGWGVLATWWVGVGLGIPLAIAARAGSRPKRGMKDLWKPMAVLFVAVAGLSLLAGMCGYFAARSGAVRLIGSLAADVPSDKHVPFLADLWAHTAAYAGGFFGGLLLMVKTWRIRGKDSAR
jgi:hypothetical protein